MQPAQIDWASTLMGEILVASVLGKVLYTYPEKDWLQSLADEEVFSESPLGSAQPDVQKGLALLQDWTCSARGGMTAEAFDDLCADYTRLMLGPGKVMAPPWESVYHSAERLIFQEKTLQVRAWYQRFHLEAENLHNEPDDHIGLELAFVAHLARQALIAFEQQKQAAFECLLAAQRDFLREHLLKWGLQWCTLLQSQANTDFFRGIALLTRGILAELAAMMQVEGSREVSR
jgi:TorA maturation chaperone TorD